jgi:hypothetical protein
MRSCTCHPSEAPVPCQHKYVFSECVKTASGGSRQKKTRRPRERRRAKEGVPNAGSDHSTVRRSSNVKTISAILGCASATNVREPEDFYRTPRECTEALIAAEGDRMPGVVWDPCCGKGDISVALEKSGRSVVSTDLVDRGFGCGGVDFLQIKTPLARAAVTNPPFDRAEEILRHAAAIGIDYLVFLHKAQWLNYQERAVMLDQVWCPARCWLLTWRPDFKSQGAPTMDCSWYVFERATMKARSWSCGLLLKPLPLFAAAA